MTVDTLSRADASRLVPALEGAFAAHYYVPTDGYVDPPRQLAALAADAVAFGVDVRSDARVTDLHIEGSRVLGVHTTQGLVPAGAVLVAAGPWTASLAARASTLLAVQPIPLRQARTASCGVASDHPVVRFPEAGAYVRPEGGGYLFGAFLPSRAPLPDPWSPGAPSEQLTSDLGHSEGLRRHLARWMPPLGVPPIDHCRQGWTTFTPDGLPLAGRDPVLSNLWFATGCGAMGIVWAPALGRWLAQSIAEHHPIPLLTALDTMRFADRVQDRLWVRGESVRRHDDYYGLADAGSGADPEGPSAEHYSWK